MAKKNIKKKKTSPIKPVGSDNCDCISKTESALFDKVVEQNNQVNGFHLEEAHFENTSIFPKSSIYLPFTTLSTYIKKDGSISKPIKKIIPVFPTYCPFCGKLINKK